MIDLIKLVEERLAFHDGNHTEDWGAYNKINELKWVLDLLKQRIASVDEIINEIAKIEQENVNTGIGCAMCGGLFTNQYRQILTNYYTQPVDVDGLVERLVKIGKSYNPPLFRDPEELAVIIQELTNLFIKPIDVKGLAEKKQRAKYRTIKYVICPKCDDTMLDIGKNGNRVVFSCMNCGEKLEILEKQKTEKSS